MPIKMDKTSLKSGYIEPQDFQAISFAAYLRDGRDPFMAGKLLPLRVLVGLHGFQAFITLDLKPCFPGHILMHRFGMMIMERDR
jgi:hypothetical protein